MKQVKIIFVLLALCFVCVFPYFSWPSVQAESILPAQTLMNELFQILPQNRTAFSQGEAQTATILGNKMLEIGVTSLFKQEFLSQDGALSQNVIGKLPSISDSPNVVIFGAHYDNVFSSSTNGYGDNLSGVAALLQTIQKLKNKNQHFNAYFVLFGAEEVGLWGSKHFVANLTQTQKDNTYLFVNIDSVGMGDSLFYSNGGDYPNYLRFVQKVNYDLNSHFRHYMPNLAYPSTNSRAMDSLVLRSDMLPFLKAGINAVTLFAGSNVGLFEKWKESASHSPIAHRSDTPETAQSVFGSKFYSNIEHASNLAAKIPLSNGFLNECLPSEQVPIYFDLLFVKLIALACIVFLMPFGWFFVVKPNCVQL